MSRYKKNSSVLCIFVRYLTCGSQSLSASGSFPPHQVQHQSGSYQDQGPQETPGQDDRKNCSALTLNGSERKMFDLRGQISFLFNQAGFFRSAVSKGMVVIAYGGVLVRKRKD